MTTMPGDTIKRLTIKKYPNRRYYDATRSRHVTLEEIYALIRDGYEIHVTDSKTGDDITAKVLAQIIIELDPFKLGVFPVPLLHRLLQSNEQSVTDFARRYFEQMFGAYLESQRGLEQYWQRMAGVRGRAPTFADWARVMWGMPGAESAATAPAANPPAAPNPPPASSPAAAGPPAENGNDLRSQVEFLRDRLERLQARLSAGPKRKSKPLRS